MRWLVGWSSVAASFATTAGARAGAANGAYGSGHDSGSPYGSGSPYDPGYASGYAPAPDRAAEGRTVQPVGAQLLWGGPDPLWAVGDWRPDEVRVLAVDDHTRIAVLGCCAASDEELRIGLLTARGGALRHLTAWPGSYTAVARTGRRVTVTGDLAGARPVFHTPWAGGTAYATAALPLADLVEAQLDIGHLAALLACPETPEALRDSTPYEGVRRVPPGHALILREGSREITGYEQVASLAVAAPESDPRQAVEGVRDALIEAVRARLTAPRHAPEVPLPDPGPVPGMGPADRRAARGAGPAPGIGADLSGGSASGTLALLAAGLPGVPGTITGHGAGAGSGCSPSRSTTWRRGPVRAARRSWSGPGRSPRTRGCTTWSSRRARRPSRTRRSTGRSPTSRGPRWSRRSGTAGGSWAAAPTTSRAWARSRSWTRTRRASRTS